MSHLYPLSNKEKSSNLQALGLQLDPDKSILLKLEAKLLLDKVLQICNKNKSSSSSTWGNKFYKIIFF